jgi:hypothetical protein
MKDAKVREWEAILGSLNEALMLRAQTNRRVEHAPRHQFATLDRADRNDHSAA